VHFKLSRYFKFEALAGVPPARDKITKAVRPAAKIATAILLRLALLFI
jgi:hypothetical protein